MPRNRLFFTASIVLAVVLIIGAFAIRSRGDDNRDVETQPARNCPPIARADAVATKPGAPISIDVLANDTDPDGDPLVFKILKTVGGDATVDDGGTPTDAIDDRVQFTPEDPPPPTATVDYSAEDPGGKRGEATVTVVINADGLLPADVHSEEIPAGDGNPSGDTCGTDRATTSTTDTTLEPSVTGTTVRERATTATTLRGRTATTTRSRSTTTTPSATTQPHTTTPTTRPPTTTTQPRPTTTQTTQVDPCGPFPQNGTPQEQDAWRACEKDRAQHGG